MAITIVGDLNVVQTAYDRLAYFALRPELYFDAVADVKPTRQTMPGSSVKFTLFDDLSVASTALNESTDVTPETMGDSQVTVTLAEYGNAVQHTAKLRGTSFIEINSTAANLIGFNAGVSIDTVARDVLKAGDNVRYAGSATSRATTTPSDTLAASNVRRALADLRAANVPTFNGDYAAWIHPDVSYDLRTETGTAAWSDPVAYSDASRRWNGEIGKFEGFRFVETPRAPIWADAGSSTTLTDVYGTLFAGRQCLAKAWSMQDGNAALPKTLVTPVTDRLQRFHGVGWYWLGGYARFREAALRRVESASSIGTNSA